MMRTTVAIAILMNIAIAGVARTNRNTQTDVKSQNLALLADTSLVPLVGDDPLLSYQNLVFKRRLDSLQKTVPLTYNEHVQRLIDIISEKGKDRISRAIGLCSYYFPIYEKVFKETGIPEEMKYLSVVESALDPNAVSRVGATGLWQFMYTTGKMYGLHINDWIDERRDPVAASYAASSYLKDAYNQFGDWLLAIASYNCGSGNVSRAIRRAGGVNDFWAIRRFLPMETQNYVPAFIATVYLMNNYKKHYISPIAPDFDTETEILQVDHTVSLSSVAKLANVDLRVLAILNPAYKKRIIRASPDKPKALVVPRMQTETFDAVYAAVNRTGVGRADNLMTASYVPKESGVSKSGTYKVRQGDNLKALAERFEVEVQDLKVWNNLQRGVIVPGQTLRVAGPQPSVLRVSSYFNYRVQEGDTLLKIAEKFSGVTVRGLKVVNEVNNGDLKPGMLLKIVKG